MTTNRFPATCERCHKNIEPGDGFVKGGKGSDGTWTVVHNSCIPVAIPEDAKGPDPDYWHNAIVRRVRDLVLQLETLDPEDLQRLRHTPQFARLRELMLLPLEYDL